MGSAVSLHPYLRQDLVVHVVEDFAFTEVI